ncbi:hypothetical protein Pcinc_008516 [Petrolisthes cinctipes]|uniref:Uncharacterized protein n=1 Tax=Petrolisthes cinctipes TaxID=88211 RepID=A0AAE1G795_PETCI|nr:hypothetical protein Pcinc_008516 [Petrolisthes cinctipes]
MASEAAMFQCSVCDKLYLLEYEAHMCLSTHYEQEEDANGSVVLVQPDQDIPQRYSCGHCRVVYDTQERASMCLARHAAQDTWMESEACASGSSSAIGNDLYLFLNIRDSHPCLPKSNNKPVPQSAANTMDRRDDPWGYH